MHHQRAIRLLALLLTLPFIAHAGETIPYPPGTKLGGAASYLGTLNHEPSYFIHADVYNLGNTLSRVVLPHFRTYQQTTEYTCGPAAVVMAADYRGVRLNELKVARAVGSTEETGTSTAQLVTYLTSHGWTVRSSLSEPKIASLQFLKREIGKGNPVLVEWVDWAGHWEVVIGYDDMGTPDQQGDDVLIVAVHPGRPLSVYVVRS